MGRGQRGRAEILLKWLRREEMPEAANPHVISGIARRFWHFTAYLARIRVESRWAYWPALIGVLTMIVTSSTPYRLKTSSVIAAPMA